MPKATGNNSTARAAWGEARLRRIGRVQEEIPAGPMVQGPQLPTEVEINNLNENNVFDTNDEESEVVSFRSDGEISDDPEPVMSMSSSSSRTSTSNKPFLADKLQQQKIELQKTEKFSIEKMEIMHQQLVATNASISFRNNLFVSNGKTMLTTLLNEHAKTIDEMSHTTFFNLLNKQIRVYQDPKGTNSTLKDLREDIFKEKIPTDLSCF